MRYTIEQLTIRRYSRVNQHQDYIHVYGTTHSIMPTMSIAQHKAHKLHRVYSTLSLLIIMSCRVINFIIVIYMNKY